MPRKRKPKKSNLPRFLIVAGLALLVVVVLMVKDKHQATTTASGKELPELQLVNALQAGQPTLAFYHSTNCEQCIIMMDIVAQVYPEYREEVALVDVDVYDQRNAPLLRKVGLQYIPTLVFYNQNGERQVHVGVMEADMLRNTLATISR